MSTQNNQNTRESGINEGAKSLAKLFMEKHGNLARLCRTRRLLNELYDATISSWAVEPTDEGEPRALPHTAMRPFSQVLYALAHGLKELRVVNHAVSA